MARNGTNGADVSGNTDRRVRRTRDTLGDALVGLMQEKAFDDITVQDVLDRAGVGRSTFYAHYRDKDDLFLSDVEDFFEMCSAMLTRNGAAKERIVPVRELFTHVGEVREFYAALVASGKVQDVRELGVGIFARSIKERLRLAGSGDSLSVTASSHALAGSLFSLLDWWVGSGMRMTPEEVDLLFHDLAGRAIYQ